MSLRERLIGLRQKLVGHEIGVLREDQQRQLRSVRLALGSLMARQVAGSAADCNSAEFTVYSQFGEDGIIEFLIQRCDISPCSFVEIGVETYDEANTRFLAEHRLWRGLIIDQNPHLDRDLRRTQLHWRAQLEAASSFVTVDNIRDLVAPFVGSEGLGLLSVDIDGVDYWILEQLVGFDPALVVVEYNALFGDSATVAVPYDSAFDRTKPGFHNIYYGASLGAFEHLLARHGYALVACTTAGNNAFFVRSDRLGDVRALSTPEAFKPRRFVEHREIDGHLTGLADPARQRHSIQELPLVDVATSRSLCVRDLFDDR